jgi:hypothetical protein
MTARLFGLGAAGYHQSGPPHVAMTAMNMAIGIGGMNRAPTLSSIVTNAPNFDINDTITTTTSDGHTTTQRGIAMFKAPHLFVPGVHDLVEDEIPSSGSQLPPAPFGGHSAFDLLVRSSSSSSSSSSNIVTRPNANHLSYNNLFGPMVPHFYDEAIGASSTSLSSSMTSSDNSKIHINEASSSPPSWLTSTELPSQLQQLLCGKKTELNNGCQLFDDMFGVV